MIKAILKKQEELDVLNGFPWIFRGEVDKLEGEIKSGSDVKVYDAYGNFVCVGYLNLASKILIRVLSLKEEALDSAFFETRIKDALEHRKNLGIDKACRLIFSEADFLPGLVVDKYNDYLVVEFATLGMDVRKELIISALNKIVKPLGIYERSDTLSRGKEGLEPVRGFIGKEFPSKQIIEENEIKLSVDLVNGQKTGHFFDQRQNRALLKNYVKDKEVLDLFCHTGSFGLHASFYGAKHVTSVDISKTAISTLEENIKLNNFNNFTPIVDDVFNFLDNAVENSNKYDVVVLDPPAFTKNKDTLKDAYKGYLNINSKALKIVENGGYLFTFSCSGHLNMDLFLQMIRDAGVKSGRRIQLVDFRIQASDHPVLVSGLENLYLKCAVLRVLD